MYFWIRDCSVDRTEMITLKTADAAASGGRTLLYLHIITAMLKYGIEIMWHEGLPLFPPKFIL